MATESRSAARRPEWDGLAWFEPSLAGLAMKLGEVVRMGSSLLRLLPLAHPEAIIES
jgi:hypothetical protein